ncbi:MAG: CopG family transcriptional regulator [Candidatus Dormiibacterota bacterium]
MRTTVRLDPDVVAALPELRRRRSLGLSAALNELVGRGLVDRRPVPKRFRQRTAALGLRLDISNVAEALGVLEQPEPS